MPVIDEEPEEVDSDSDSDADDEQPMPALHTIAGDSFSDSGSDSGSDSDYDSDSGAEDSGGVGFSRAGGAPARNCGGG